MSALRTALIAIAALLALQTASLAAPVQTVPGPRVNTAAEGFVSTALTARPADVRSVYSIPDRLVPSGGVTLKPHWPAGALAPRPGFRGRLNVPVSLVVGGVIVDEVLVQVQVGLDTAATTTQLGKPSAILKTGDPVHVQLQGSGLNIVLMGTMQQDANQGDRVRVAVQGPYRILFATVKNDREVAVEPEP
ncbi:MAG: hypothetical protein EB084_02605 [Proteobacteria bacterium]|nr:hypothetical protein [Pseudomonadota bacterium]